MIPTTGYTIYSIPCSYGNEVMLNKTTKVSSCTGEEMEAAFSMKYNNYSKVGHTSPLISF